MGRYYDAETGLYYNWNRYYDPRTGRYITSDPVGIVPGVESQQHIPDPTDMDVSSAERSVANVLLRHGLNQPYAYVENNPLRWIDVFGLRRVPVVVTTMGTQVISLGSIFAPDCGTTPGGCHGSFEERLKITLTAEASDSCVLRNVTNKVINGQKTRVGPLIQWWQEIYEIFHYVTAKGACGSCALTDFREETHIGSGVNSGSD